MRVRDDAYRRLKADIVEWRLAPGTKLPEVEVAARLGVSRTPLREAFARLSADGLLDRSSGRTPKVASFEIADVERLFELRIVLEVAAVRAAAQRGRVEHFAELAERFREHAVDIEPVDGYYRLIAASDRAIAEAAGNPEIARALDDVRSRLARARTIAREHPTRLRETANEHAMICSAIAERDAELAVAAITVHLRNALEHIRATIDPTTEHDR